MIQFSTGCTASHTKNQTTSCSIKDIHVGLPTKFFEKANGDFIKVKPAINLLSGSMFECKEQDEYGGRYYIRCLEDECIGIVVNYTKSPISRKEALNILYRILPLNKGTITDHDQNELIIPGAIKPTEFFYFGTLYGGGINYTDSGTVAFVHAWLDKDLDYQWET